MEKLRKEKRSKRDKLKKMEQIYSKSSLSMKNDKKSLDEVNKIVDNARLILKNNNNIILHIAIGFVVILITIIILVKI